MWFLHELAILQFSKFFVSYLLLQVFFFSVLFKIIPFFGCIGS